MIKSNKILDGELIKKLTDDFFKQKELYPFNFQKKRIIYLVNSFLIEFCGNLIVKNFKFETQKDFKKLEELLKKHGFNTKTKFSWLHDYNFREYDSKEEFNKNVRNYSEKDKKKFQRESFIEGLYFDNITYKNINGLRRNLRSDLILLDTGLGKTIISFGLHWVINKYFESFLNKKTKKEKNIIDSKFFTEKVLLNQFNNYVKNGTYNGKIITKLKEIEGFDKQLIEEVSKKILLIFSKDINIEYKKLGIEGILFIDEIYWLKREKQEKLYNFIKKSNKHLFVVGLTAEDMEKSYTNFFKKEGRWYSYTYNSKKSLHNELKKSKLFNYNEIFMTIVDLKKENEKIEKEVEEMKTKNKSIKEIFKEYQDCSESISKYIGLYSKNKMNITDFNIEINKIKNRFTINNDYFNKKLKSKKIGESLSYILHKGNIEEILLNGYIFTKLKQKTILYLDEYWGKNKIEEIINFLKKHNIEYNLFSQALLENKNFLSLWENQVLIMDRKVTGLDMQGFDNIIFLFTNFFSLEGIKQGMGRVHRIGRSQNTNKEGIFINYDLDKNNDIMKFILSGKHQDKTIYDNKEKIHQLIQNKNKDQKNKKTKEKKSNKLSIEMYEGDISLLIDMVESIKKIKLLYMNFIQSLNSGDPKILEKSTKLLKKEISMIIDLFKKY